MKIFLTFGFGASGGTSKYLTVNDHLKKKNMKYIFNLISYINCLNLVYSQNLEPEMLFPDTLRSSTDSFVVTSSNFDNIYRQFISKKDTFNLGTAGYRGVYMKISTDIDTLIIAHTNFPNDQLIKIPIASPNDTALCIIRFQGNISDFTNEYANKTKDTYKIEIPEIYELANIILYLSQCSEKTNNHPLSEYASRVEEYFRPFKNHKLIQVLNNKCLSNNLWNTYYGFRENSICFEIEENNLQYKTPYKHVYFDGVQMNGGHFRNMSYLVQDFLNQSKFQNFYNDNYSYYSKLIERQNQLLPIKQMWAWLEKEFPQRMDSYKIIFSPLIGGSHSTQKYLKGFFIRPEFQECIMFINSPESVDAKTEYSEVLKKGLMSGIVFTEIDHNYVNPASAKNFNAIKDLLKNKDIWATKDAQEHYQSEYSIFNEYMTHSLFCLYINESYNEEEGREIVNQRIKLMERRGFIKFEQFNDKLIHKLKVRKRTVYEMYAEVIEIMNEIK